MKNVNELIHDVNKHFLLVKLSFMFNIKKSVKLLFTVVLHVFYFFQRMVIKKNCLLFY